MTQAKRMVKHSSIYAIGNISRQLVGFVMLPVYTHYLTPADYGVVGLLIFMVSLIELVFGGHMFHAVPKYYFEQEGDRDRKTIISTALLLTSVISLTAVIAVVLLRDYSSLGIFGTQEYGLVVAMFSVLILTQGLENYALVYIRIQSRPWLFISVNFAKLFLQLALNIWFVVILEWGVLGIASSTLLSSTIFAAGMTIYTLRSTGLNYSSAIALKLFRFCWPLWVSGLAGLYIGSANRYFIRIFSSLDDVGLFELAAKFGSIIMLLVWTPFAQYWQTERFKIYQEPNPIPIYQNVFKYIGIMLVAVGFLIGLYAGPVIKIMSAEAFHSAADAVPFLVYAAVFQCLTIFCNFSFLVKEKTGWMSRNNYITAVIVTGFYFALIPVLGFVGASIALMLAHMSQFFMVFFVAKKHYDMQLPLSPLLIALIICSAALAAGFVYSTASWWADVGVKALLSLLVMMLLSAYLWRDQLVREQVIAGWRKLRA